jgi:hypothetical protein
LSLVSAVCRQTDRSFIQRGPTGCGVPSECGGHDSKSGSSHPLKHTHTHNTHTCTHINTYTHIHSHKHTHTHTHTHTSNKRKEKLLSSVMALFSLAKFTA